MPVQKRFLSLLVILLPTILLWQGVRHSGFTPDDYYIIDYQSPIGTAIDALSMFWRIDPNPQYWRPVTNSTVSIDFLLWGWDGGMFHVTNLLLHLIATILVYYFLLRILRLQEWLAIALTSFFGIAACHDANLLWIAARSDIIATINILATLLAAEKAQATNHKRWRVLSWLFFLLALASKEVSGLAILLLPTLVWSDTPRDLWRKRKQLLYGITPYFLIAILFLFVRLQFTVPLDEMQPIVAEGSRSPVAFLKNALYSIGYVLAPLDFATASAIINQYLTFGFIAAGILLGMAILVLWKGDRELLRLLYRPVILLVVTGLVSFQSFERWRVYFPSVGIFVIVALILLALWRLQPWRFALRGMVIALTCALVVFNVSQALTKQNVWSRATDMIADYRADVQQILSSDTVRPITLNVITSPIKLGDAPLLQLSNPYLAHYAEALRKREPLLDVGNLGSAPEDIGYYSNVNIYALDPDRGFEGLLINHRDSVLSISVQPGAKLAFVPSLRTNDGVAIRDRQYHQGAQYPTYGATVTAVNVNGAFLHEASIQVDHSAGLPIYFDGKDLRELR